MSSRASSSAALPIVYLALRILIVLNWVYGAAIFTLLVAMPTERWIMSAFELSPSPAADRLIMGLRGIAMIGLATIPLNYVILRRLLFARGIHSLPRTRTVCRRLPGCC